MKERSRTWEILVPFLCQHAVHRLPGCQGVSRARHSALGPWGQRGVPGPQPAQGHVRGERDTAAGRGGDERRLPGAQGVQEAEDTVQFTSDAPQRV